ncbi:MAG TPA: Ig-like domain-containing protein [Gemmatimonadales bacterium]|nr:Ig-like domain-containing protein [Gemmatimonadales bacterium]
MRRSTQALVLAAAVVACHESLVVLPPPAPVASLTVSPAADTVTVGDSVQLTATARDAAGNVIASATVTWTSDSVTFASVTGAGLVRTASPGFAPIIATAGGKSDTAAITVTPVQLLAPVAGGHHTCALTNGGATYCWGRDVYGQLGGGFVSVAPETAPILVTSTGPYSALAAGESHTCALAGNGAAFCWGDNAGSQLGSSGGPAANPVPGAVTGGHAFGALTAGDRHTCGSGTDSLTYCWGANDSGQLGDSVPGSGGPTPMPVATRRRYVSLAAGGVHTCGVSAGVVYCWGGNASGELGDSTDSTRRSPVAVHNPGDWLDVTAGTSHTCGRLLDRSALCWGKNDHGQLGTGQADSLTRVPVAVTGGKSWIMLAAGGAHTCGIAADSLAYCWGANGSGQLGDSSFTDRPAPVAVYGGIHFSWITAGDAHTCAFATTAALYCWGENGDGQLGDHTTTARPAPVLVRP